MGWARHWSVCIATRHQASLYCYATSAVFFIGVSLGIWSIFQDRPQAWGVVVQHKETRWYYFGHFVSFLLCLSMFFVLQCLFVLFFDFMFLHGGTVFLGFWLLVACLVFVSCFVLFDREEERQRIYGCVSTDVERIWEKLEEGEPWSKYIIWKNVEEKCLKNYSFYTACLASWQTVTEVKQVFLDSNNCWS